MIKYNHEMIDTKMFLLIMLKPSLEVETESIFKSPLETCSKVVKFAEIYCKKSAFYLYYNMCLMFQIEKTSFKNYKNYKCMCFNDLKCYDQGLRLWAQC